MNSQFIQVDTPCEHRFEIMLAHAVTFADHVLVLADNFAE
jgi:hypothetical protein